MAFEITFLKISRSFEKALDTATPIVRPQSELNLGPIDQTFSVAQRSFTISCTYHKGYLYLLHLIFAFRRIPKGYLVLIYFGFHLDR